MISIVQYSHLPNLTVVMQDIQAVFSRVQENKKKMKDLRTAYKDALSGTQQFVDISDEIKTLREKKKQIENTIKEQFAAELTQLEDLKIDIQSDMELMSDIAMTQIMNGEQVSLMDEYDNEYEPIFKVSFKKS